MKRSRSACGWTSIPRARPPLPPSLNCGSAASSASSRKRLGRAERRAREWSGRDAADAAVPGDQGAPPERDPVLPDGRLLRDVLRGRRDGVARARTHAHVAQQRRRRRSAARRRAGASAGQDYLRRLVQQGYRVAICEQVEDPKLAKGIVRREVVETIIARRGVRRRPARRRAQQLHRGDRAVEPRRRAATARTRSWASPPPTSRPASSGCASSPLDELDAAARAPRAARAAGAARRTTPLPRTAYARRRARHGARGVGVRRRAGARRPRAPVRRAGTRGTRPRSRRRAGDRRRGRAAALPAGAAAGGFRISRGRGRAVGRHDAARRDDAPQPRAGGVAARRRARKARCSRCSTARSRRWARACCASGCSRRSSIARRSRRGSMRSRRCVRDPSARDALRAALDGVRDVERLAARRRPAARRRASSRALGASLARLPEVERAARRLAGAGAIGVLMSRWDGCAETAIASPRDARRAAATAARRRGDDRDRRRSRARRAAHAARRRQGRDRADPGGGARAHRHRVAQGRLQQGVRILHRGLQRQPPSRARRLPAATDADRRRAVRDAGAQGVRGEGPHGRGAHRDARARAVRSAACRASDARSAACSAPRGSSRSSTCSPHSPTWRRARGTRARRSPTASTSRS